MARPKKNQPKKVVVPKTDIPNTPYSNPTGSKSIQSGQDCATVKPRDWEKDHLRERCNELESKWHPIREFTFALEGFAKLNGSIPESVFNKLFVRNRVKL